MVDDKKLLCSNCGEAKKELHTKGDPLCFACYSYQYRNGRPRPKILAALLAERKRIAAEEDARWPDHAPAGQQGPSNP